MKATETKDPTLEASFATQPLREALQNNLSSLGYDVMTPIQIQSLPPMLNGQDVIAKAKTGSGKTAAFGLSLLNILNAEYFEVQALVLCPTRELAEQVSQALRRLARLMPNIKVLNLSGGTPMRPQTDSLRHGAHIIVGTPGRVQKHLDKGSLSLDRLLTLVLDEADRMLDMGFMDAIKEIVRVCPRKRQTLLFSATYPDEIKKLSRAFMQNPKEVSVDTEQDEIAIAQRFYEVVPPLNKFSILKSILFHHKPSSTLIFCNTKQQTAQLANQLNKEGFSAVALNGDMEQAERDLAVIRFANQSCSIMVATDVAARGLDIKELPAVINYELAFEHDVHIHRVGRTGRAGHKGLAFSLTTSADGMRLAAIEEGIGHALSFGDVKELSHQDKEAFLPEMVTLCLDAGRKDKIRPGDILGALIKDAGLPMQAVGKIDIADFDSYVAIQNNFADKAFKYLQSGKLKARRVNVKKLR
ncbi:MAG: ATP-dependent RNA helicase DbpA [Gammaproteobacteria bacterium]|nr:ATP-dependent RNA helicase DbpA [Gammaproteobacteria bacterium]